MQKKISLSLAACLTFFLLLQNVAFAAPDTNLVTSNQISQLQNTQSMMNQSGYIIIGASSDKDGDGYNEPPGMVNIGTTNADGGKIPTTTGAFITDGYGKPFAYCAWNNGSNSATTIGLETFLSGTTGTSAKTFAIISAGPDGVFQTSCANVAAGVTNGDDLVFYASEAQVRTANGNLVSLANNYWNQPVANAAALSALNTSALNDGEVRIKTDDNTLWKWNAGTSQWVTVGAAGWAINGTSVYQTNTALRVLVGTATDNGIDTLQVNGSALANSFKVSGTYNGTVIDSAGNWTGTIISAAKGGTGLDTHLAGNGKLLIGNGAGFSLANLSQGANNGVVITNGSGGITLDTAQDIRTAASPTFAGITVSGSSNFNGQLNANAGIATTALTASGNVIGASVQGNSGIITSNAPAISGSQTWNAGGVAFTGMLLNITNTASAAGSKLMDLQVGGVSQYSVDKNGNLTIGGTLAVTGATTLTGLLTANGGIVNGADKNILLQYTSTPSMPANGFYMSAANTVSVAAGSTKILDVSATGLNIASGSLMTGGTTRISSTGVLTATTGSFSGVITASNGAVGAPSINLGDATTGLYRSAANNLDIAVSGANLANFSSTGLTLAADKRLAFQYASGGTAPSNGLLMSAANQLSLYSNSAETLRLNSSGMDIRTGGLLINGTTRIDSTGNLTANNATIGGTLGVTGATTLSSTLAVTGATTLTGLLTANGGIVNGADKNILLQYTSTPSMPANGFYMSAANTVSVAAGSTKILDVSATGLNIASGSLMTGGTTRISSTGVLTNVTWNGNAITPAYGGTGVNAGSATNGQLLIGNGAGLTLANLTGTANQIIVTNGTGSITLSLPQAIATNSTPTFGGLTNTGNETIGGTLGVTGLTTASGGISSTTGTFSSNVNLTAGSLQINGTQLIGTDGSYYAKANSNKVIDTNGYVYVSAPGNVTSGNACTQTGAIATDGTGNLYICN